MARKSTARTPPAHVDAKLKADEFNRVLPALDGEQHAGLEALIREESCLDSIKTWRNPEGDEVVVDGHNRYEICARHGIPFRTEPLKFADRAEVIAWMWKNQTTRRNLKTDFAKVEQILATLGPELQKKGKRKRAAGLKQNAKRSRVFDDSVPLTSAERTEPIDSRRQIADAAGVSPDTVQKVLVILTKADEATKQSLRSGEPTPRGETTLNKAYQAIRDPAKRKPVVTIRKCTCPKCGKRH
jgi:hypothetical protein